MSFSKKFWVFQKELSFPKILLSFSKIFKKNSKNHQLSLTKCPKLIQNAQKNAKIDLKIAKKFVKMPLFEVNFLCLKSDFSYFWVFGNLLSFCKNGAEFREKWPWVFRFQVGKKTLMIFWFNTLCSWINGVGVNGARIFGLSSPKRPFYWPLRRSVTKILWKNS